MTNVGKKHNVFGAPNWRGIQIRRIRTKSYVGHLVPVVDDHISQLQNIRQYELQEIGKKIQTEVQDFKE
jgi:hypothetical protein